MFVSESGSLCPYTTTLSGCGPGAVHGSLPLDGWVILLCSHTTTPSGRGPDEMACKGVEALKGQLGSTALPLAQTLMGRPLTSLQPPQKPPAGLRTARHARCLPPHD